MIINLYELRCLEINTTSSVVWIINKHISRERTTEERQVEIRDARDRVRAEVEALTQERDEERARRRLSDRRKVRAMAVASDRGRDIRRLKER